MLALILRKKAQMYTLETVESLQAYANRLHREVATSRRRSDAPHASVRSLFRSATRSRRSA